MRKRNLLLMAILCLGMLSKESPAQKLFIKMNNGNENTETLSTVQKIHFSGGDLIVDFKSGSDDIYSLADIRKLYFDAEVSVDENARDAGTLSVYPNPANTVISVKGIPLQEGMLRIFCMDGRPVYSQEITSEHESIDISSLPDGLYLINAAGFTSKFIKK